MDTCIRYGWMDGRTDGRTDGIILGMQNAAAHSLSMAFSSEWWLLACH